MKLKEQEENCQMLKQLGLNEYLCQIDSEILQENLMMGMLTMQEKNMFNFNKKWLLLISSRSIFERKELGEKIKQDQLPKWFLLDHLYVFCEKSEDNWGYDSKLDLSLVEQLEVNEISSNAKDQVNLTYFLDDLSKIFKKGNVSNDFYSFKLADKKSNYVFFTDYITILNKWINALENAVHKTRLGKLVTDDNWEDQEEDQQEEQQQDNKSSFSSGGFLDDSVDHNDKHSPENSKDQEQSQEQQQQQQQQQQGFQAKFSSGQVYSLQKKKSLNQVINWEQLAILKNIDKAYQRSKTQLLPTTVIRLGFLQEGFCKLKVNSDIIKNYQEKYIRLYPTDFSIYKTFECTVPLKTYLLRDLKQGQAYKLNKVRVETKDSRQIFTLSLHSGPERDQWIASLNTQIEQALPEDRKLSLQSTYDKIQQHQQLNKSNSNSGLNKQNSQKLLNVQLTSDNKQNVVKASGGLNRQGSNKGLNRGKSQLLLEPREIIMEHSQANESVVEEEEDNKVVVNKLQKRNTYFISKDILPQSVQQSSNNLNSTANIPESATKNPDYYRNQQKYKNKPSFFVRLFSGCCTNENDQ